MVDISELSGKHISVDEANDIISEDKNMSSILNMKAFFLFGTFALVILYVTSAFGTGCLPFIFAGISTYIFCSVLEYRRLYQWHDFFEESNVIVDYDEYEW